MWVMKCVGILWSEDSPERSNICAKAEGTKSQSMELTENVPQWREGEVDIHELPLRLVVQRLKAHRMTASARRESN